MLCHPNLVPLFDSSFFILLIKKKKVVRRFLSGWHFSIMEHKNNEKQK